MLVEPHPYVSVLKAIKVVFLSSLLIPALSAWWFLWIWSLWLIFSYLSLLIVLMSHHFPSFLEGSNHMICLYKSHVPCLGAQGVFFNSKYFYKVLYGWLLWGYCLTWLQIFSISGKCSWIAILCISSVLRLWFSSSVMHLPCPTVTIFHF